MDSDVLLLYSRSYNDRHRIVSLAKSARRQLVSRWPSSVSFTSIAMGVSSEDTLFSFSLPRNLTTWWSEETEHVLQRIERWAAYARGYNRLKSVRLSPGRMTMQDEPEARWSINEATRRIQVDSGWAPSFRNNSRRSATAERSRLNRLPTGYSSNGNLDTNCLESYAMDHSIFFKTIGDLRNEPVVSKSTTNNNNNNNCEDIGTPTTPLDCGDFLSSDFDDDQDDDDLLELDAADYELREQLERLEADHDQLDTEGVIQLCRSCISEEDINNNFTATGLPRIKPTSLALATVR